MIRLTHSLLFVFALAAAICVGCAPSAAPPPPPPNSPSEPEVPEPSEPDPVPNTPEPSDPAPEPDPKPSEPAPDPKPSEPAPEPKPSEPAPEPKPEPTAAVDPNWGTLTGTFFFDGEVPVQAKLNITKDQAICSKVPPLDETLVVSKDKGLANVVVTLYLKRGAAAPKPHPSYEKTKAQKVTLDNLNCRFEPHITLVRVDQPLVIGNSDPTGHNTKADFINNPSFNETIGAGQSLDKTFESAERLPSPVACTIHPWMKGYLVVKDHPYTAISGVDGKFEIANLPVGEWEFQVWHEKSGYVQEVGLGGKATDWSKGRFTFTIKPGQNDLGTIKVAPSVFAD